MRILCRLLKSRLTPRYFCSSRYLEKSPGKTRDDVRESNEPIQFFGSGASSWRARYTRRGREDNEELWYQPYVVCGSVAIFLLYFCVLREENDIDRKLEGSLFDHISGMEELQLSMSYKYNKENGLDTKDLEKRLLELGVDVEELKKSVGTS